VKFLKIKRKSKDPEPKIVKRDHRTICDMEIDGVYFSEDAIKFFEEKRRSLLCEYSGLPSVSSYK
jgi:hypothetical protein